MSNMSTEEVQEAIKKDPVAIAVFYGLREIATAVREAGGDVKAGIRYSGNLYKNAAAMGLVVDHDAGSIFNSSKIANDIWNPNL